MAAPHQIGHGALGHIHGGLAVEQHHFVQCLQANLLIGAHLAEPGGVDEPPDLRPLPLQQVAVLRKCRLLRQIHGQNPQAARSRPIRQRGAEFIHFLPPTGDEPDLVQFLPPQQLARKLRPQSAGGPGNDCDSHDSSPLS